MKKDKYFPLFSLFCTSCFHAVGKFVETCKGQGVFLAGKQLCVWHSTWGWISLLDPSQSNDSFHFLNCQQGHWYIKDPVWTIRSTKHQAFSGRLSRCEKAFRDCKEKSFQGPELDNEEELREKLKELQARGAHNWAAEEVEILLNRVTCWVFNCRWMSTWKALVHFRESSPIFWTFSTTAFKHPMTRYINCFVVYVIPYSLQGLKTWVWREGSCPSPLYLWSFVNWGDIFLRPFKIPSLEQTLLSGWGMEAEGGGAPTLDGLQSSSPYLITPFFIIKLLF